MPNDTSSQAVSKINDAQTISRRRYQTKRQRATYKPFPDFDALMEECERVDTMSNEGNTKQPTHAAYIRLVEQARLFVQWYSTVFPAYFKQRRITKEEVYVLIRMYNNSISSLLSLLDQRVQQNKASQIPIDKPMAWSRAVVEREIAHELVLQP